MLCSKLCKFLIVARMTWNPALINGAHVYNIANNYCSRDLMISHVRWTTLLGNVISASKFISSPVTTNIGHEIYANFIVFRTTTWTYVAINTFPGSRYIAVGISSLEATKFRSLNDNNDFHSYSLVKQRRQTSVFGIAYLLLDIEKL